MKTTAIWVLRNLLIPVGFIWATGIFTGIKKLNSEADKAVLNDPMRTFDSCEIQTLEISPSNAIAYGDSLIATRKRQIKETGIYDPYLYFRDLKQYNMFEQVYGDSLNKTTEGKFLFIHCLSFLGSAHRGELVNIRDENWRKVDPDDRAMANYTDRSGLMYKNMSIAGARRHWFPAEAARDLAEAQGPPFSFWSDIARPFLLWLQKFYLKGLPFAFILFLIWKIKFREESAPLSFIISLLLWPIILWLDIRNRFNEVLRKAEVLSRRRNMFSLLSKTDQKLIEIGKTMSLKEFRRYLENIEMARKHSFASAFVVTCFLIIMPRIVVPVSSSYSEIIALTVIVTNIDYGIDDDAGHDFSNFSDFSWEKICKEIPFPLNVALYLLMLFEKIHFPKYLTKILSGFLREIFGVPKVANQFIKFQWNLI